jgi:transposase-like protein
MAKKQKEEERGNVIRKLIELYDVKSISDIQDALKDLLGGTIQGMLETELADHLGYSKGEAALAPKSNYRNGYKSKTLKSSSGDVEIQVPQDRNSEFIPQIIPKYSRDISGIEQKIIAMYGRGYSTRDISDQKRRNLRLRSVGGAC